MSLNMGSLFNPQSNHGIMGETLDLVKDFDDHNHDVSSSWSSSSSINGEEDENEEEEGESCVSSCSSPPTSPTSLSTPLQDMSSLLQQLPIKRGLSKHYNGKSQSFTSLSSVGCLEDLVKKENPLNKKLKTCKPYVGLPRNHTCSRLIAKKSSNNHHHNNNRNHHHHNSNRPPIPSPHRSMSTSSFTHQTRLVV